MNYNDLQFWVTLFLCILISLGLRSLIKHFFPENKEKLDTILLSSTSLVLFFFCDRLSCFIFLVEGLVTFFLLKISVNFSYKKKKYIAIVNILFILNGLFFYKYSDFILNQIFMLNIFVAKQKIPIGISFYSFQLIAFIIDTIRAPSSRLPPLSRFLSFFSFFPQIVAGPIERGKDLLPQLKSFNYSFSIDKLLTAFPLIVTGLFYKVVIADNIVTFINTSQTNNAYLIWFSLILFSFRLYFDFAGYSLIAVGLGKLFGINLTYNFLAPYMARNISDFWRKWNVSLMSWFRDYLYIPLGGNKGRLWVVPLATVWIISGIWHGAGWNFLLWGLLHCLYLIFYRLTKQHINVSEHIGIVVTYAAVTFAWLFFYEQDLSVTLIKLNALLSPLSYSSLALNSALNQYSTGEILPLISILFMAISIFASEYMHRHDPNPYSGLLSYRMSLFFLILIPMLRPSAPSSFIYFAF